jgi:hypothetical protein
MDGNDPGRLDKPAETTRDHGRHRRQFGGPLDANRIAACTWSVSPSPVNGPGESALNGIAVATERELHPPHPALGPELTRRRPGTGWRRLSRRRPGRAGRGS